MAAGLRVVFMGTPDFAAHALQALTCSPHEVAAVYTQPPRPKGRGQQLQKSAVHELAERHGIPVFTPVNLRGEDDLRAFAALKADVAVVAAYGLILPPRILSAPVHGCLNIHASLLPRWRGAAPIHRAILAGDAQTGVTIMQMEAGLDTGPMIAMEATPIAPDATTGELHDMLAAMGGRMIVDALAVLARDGKLEATAQPEEGVTYAEKIRKEEARIDWAESASIIERKIRAFQPAPGAWCLTADGKRLKILKVRALGVAPDKEPGTVLSEQGIVSCREGSLQLIEVQPEGKKPMACAAAFNGSYIEAGGMLS